MIKKAVRLTESDLNRLVNKVIKEQSKVMMDKVVSSSSSKEYNMIDTCASMGVKTPGYCDTKGKKPVKSCASLGVKTPGFCYVDSKKPIPNQAPKGKDSIKEQMAAATGQSVPQNTTGNDRISNLANMMRNLQTKQVPQKVIVAPGSQLNGMLWTDYLKQFKITKQELDQAKALMSKLGVNPQSQKPGPGAVKSTPTTKGTTPQKPTDAATAKRQQIDARRNSRQQQTAGGVKPTNPTSRQQQTAGGVKPTNPTSRMPVR